MKTLFLLLTLTQNGAGDINASFVNTQTLAQCQQKAQMVAGVFSASKIPVIENRCIKSDLPFSKFGHAASASNIRHYYLIQLDKKAEPILAMPDWYSCIAKKKNSQKQSRVYCSSSIQSIQ